MKNIVELTQEEEKEYLNKFYESFSNGYEFEDFVKLFLEKIGLDEVFVTQRSRDGGIDLTCTKIGISGLSNLDETKYYVQSKKYTPSSTISVKSIRELRGVMPSNYKGIFITTGKFSKDAIQFAEEDITRQIILIDGINLVQQCINAGIAFNLKPVYDENFIKELSKDKTENKKPFNNDEKFEEQFSIVVEKQITQNDVRAAILKIPNEIKNKLNVNQKSLDILFNSKTLLKLNISNDKRFVSGVTQLYRELGLITNDNIITPKIAEWKYSSDKMVVNII